MTRKRPDARAVLFERIRTAPAKFVHVTGVPYAIEPAPAPDAAASHTLWLTLEVPPYGRMRAVLRTAADESSDDDSEPRAKVAVVSERWTEKPDTGLTECEGQNYAMIEAMDSVEYREYEPEALQDLLMTKAKAAVRAEVWGDLYAEDHLGVHHVHRRPPGKAIPKKSPGRDGALKLYYSEENQAELFLFRFED